VGRRGPPSGGPRGPQGPPRPPPRTTARAVRRPGACPSARGRPSSCARGRTAGGAGVSLRASAPRGQGDLASGGSGPRRALRGRGVGRRGCPGAPTARPLAARLRAPSPGSRPGGAPPRPHPAATGRSSGRPRDWTGTLPLRVWDRRQQMSLQAGHNRGFPGATFRRPPTAPSGPTGPGSGARGPPRIRFLGGPGRPAAGPGGRGEGRPSPPTAGVGEGAASSGPPGPRGARHPPPAPVLPPGGAGVPGEGRRGPAWAVSKPSRAAPPPPAAQVRLRGARPRAVHGSVRSAGATAHAPPRGAPRGPARGGAGASPDCHA